MKVCTKCKIEKSLDFFRFRNKDKNQRVSWCKSCFSEYEKNKWSSSIERRKSNLNSNKARRKKRAKFVWEYLKNHPCECGESNPIVLEFDHNDECEKNANISDMVRQGFSEKRILDEIKKCTVRCANCHRLRTASQCGWYKELLE